MNTAPGGMDDYLKLPPLDIRISNLAQEIAAPAPSNYDKAVAVEQYLLTHFGYTLELPPPPPPPPPRSLPQDPTGQFSVREEEGHCEYFASSMAVMLRSLRIPSRIVTGFRGGEFNDLTASMWCEPASPFVG